MLKEKIESSLNKAQKRNPDFCGMRKVNLVWIQSTTQYYMNTGMSNLNFRYVRLCDEDIPREKKKKKKNVLTISIQWRPWSCAVFCAVSLRKQAYYNISKILPPKNVNFQIKILIFFNISAQNIDCWYSLEPPRRGGSNEYPQSMFLSRNKKIMYTPVNPSFTI